MTLKSFRVNVSNIEWDLGKGPDIDGYSPESVEKLPREVTRTIRAEDDNEAIEKALDDITDDFCFCIQGCKTEAVVLPPRLELVR